jgi:gamma-glutamylcyclotransferase (GGCT)/AIG2-like uncharacterized protein YtfP
MIKLFSYGTLCEKNVQLREFGQEFYVEPDLDYVCGWDIIECFIDDGVYKVAIPGEQVSVFSGAIVHIPNELMQLVDEYEGPEYVRENIKTLSGVECIMYVKRTDKI